MRSTIFFILFNLITFSLLAEDYKITSCDSVNLAPGNSSTRYLLTISGTPEKIFVEISPGEKSDKEKSYKMAIFSDKNALIVNAVLTSSEEGCFLLYYDEKGEEFEKPDMVFAKLGSRGLILKDPNNKIKLLE